MKHDRKVAEPGGVEGHWDIWKLPAGRGRLSQKPGIQGTEIGVDGGLLFPPKYIARSKWTPTSAVQAILEVGWKSEWGYQEQGGVSPLSQVQ